MWDHAIGKSCGRYSIFKSASVTLTAQQVEVFEADKLPPSPNYCSSRKGPSTRTKLPAGSYHAPFLGHPVSGTKFGTSEKGVA